MRITLIIIITLLVNNCLAERDDLRFISYGTSDGISVGKVRKVFQDSKGFLWLATEDGLNRFNSYEFDVFRGQLDDSTTISSNKIYDITEDNQNRLWIATGYGLNAYNMITGKFTSFTKESGHDGFFDNEIRTLHYCNDSLLFVGTRNGGFHKMNLKTLKIKHINLPDKPKFIRNIDCFQNHLFIGTHGKGFYTFNLKTHETQHTTIKARQSSNYINQINAFLHIVKHTYWIATEDGMFQWNMQSGETTNITPNQLFADQTEVIRIRDFLRDRDSIIWIASNRGLIRYQSDQWHRYKSKDEPYSLQSNWLVDLHEDESGSIWISNKENGVNVIHNKKQKFRHYGAKPDENSLINNLVFCFDKYERRQILIGTIGGGLDVFNPVTEKFYNYNRHHSELSKKITSIFTADYNSLWLGTWGDGLQHFNPETGKIQSFCTKSENDNSLSTNTVICMYPDENNHLWIGTFDALNRINTKTREIKQYENIEGLINHTIFFIYSTHPDTLWLGTRRGGLAALDLNTMKAQCYRHDPKDTTSIPNDVVKFIHQDHNGYFWIATEMGVSRFNRQTGKFRNYTNKDGLPNNNVWAILPDDNNNLWLSTNSGIARITLDSASNVTDIKSYQKNEGLRSLEFSQGAYLRNERTGMLYFGGTEGFYAFDPAEIKPRQYEPPVQITSIKIMDKEYSGDTIPSSKHEVTIPWNKNFISFEFVGLDYAHQGNILYKYKMEGQSDKWSRPSTRRFASFPDLKDGEYVFKVKSTNSEGRWGNKSEAEIKIKIMVTPPWWRTNLAYALYIIIPIIGVIMYIRYRTRKLKKEKRVLEEIVAQRTAELRKKNKDITSSIQYAQRIQQAIIFPSINEFSDEFKKVFVLFKPKDIVSGDFFWYIKKDKTRIFTAADCTGHGVPGAFMSIIGNNLLNQIITEEDIKDPAEILTQLDFRIKESLNQKGRQSDTFDGMDIAMCAIDEGSKELIYSGAYNPLYHIRDGQLTKYKATRKSIGGSQIKASKMYFNHRISLEFGDTIYIFSDGYADQFGGPKNKKFTSRKLQEKLLNIQHENMPNQQMILDYTIEDWMKSFEQIDDMILVGVRF